METHEEIKDLVTEFDVSRIAHQRQSRRLLVDSLRSLRVNEWETLGGRLRGRTDWWNSLVGPTGGQTDKQSHSRGWLWWTSSRPTAKVGSLWRLSRRPTEKAGPLERQGCRSGCVSAEMAYWRSGLGLTGAANWQPGARVS